MREIRIRPRAQLDLESLFIYRAFELKEPNAAQKTVDAIYSAIERAAEFPEAGRLFENENLEQGYRRVLVGRYWVYYTFDDESLTVWRVFHVRQDIDNYSIVDL